MKVFSIAIAILLLSACKSSDHEVQTVKTRLEKHEGSTSSGEVGINDKGEAVIQSSTSAAAELTIQEHVNERLAADLESDRHMLKMCRADLADPRLGGSGEMAAIPEVDAIAVPASQSEEVGKDESGKLVVVRKTLFDEKLKAERERENNLKRIAKVIKKNRTECEQKMSVARTAHGLPAQRYIARGYFSNGKWIETRKAENSLDDAFEILESDGTKD